MLECNSLQNEVVALIWVRHDSQLSGVAQSLEESPWFVSSAGEVIRRAASRDRKADRKEVFSQVSYVIYNIVYTSITKSQFCD